MERDVLVKSRPLLIMEFVALALHLIGYDTSIVQARSHEFYSKIAAIRMLDQPYMTDAIEASSMGYKPQNIDIYRWNRIFSCTTKLTKINKVPHGDPPTMARLLMGHVTWQLRQCAMVSIRDVGDLDQYMFGHRVTVVRLTIAILMATPRPCGQSGNHGWIKKI